MTLYKGLAFKAMRHTPGSRLDACIYIHYVGRIKQYQESFEIPPLYFKCRLFNYFNPDVLSVTSDKK